jgi:hypothetical protein
VDSGVFILGGWFGYKIDEVLFLDPRGEELQLELFAAMQTGISDIAAVNLEGEIYLIGGAHERFQRQIRVQRWDPVSGKTDSIKFRSFLYW